MGRVLTDRLWRARNREERSNADTDPGCLGGGGENGWSTRRHSLLYCHCASEAYQQPQRAHLPLRVRFVHRLLLDRATFRFSGPPFTTADRDALCKLIGQAAECPEGIDAVEKGFWEGAPSILIHNKRRPRKIDSRSRRP